jgi:tetratricopeptide (TPR) repeat protein
MVDLVRGSLEMSSSLRVYESEHFIVSLDPGRDWVLADTALQTLEAAYEALGGWLGHFPREKIRVEIVPSAEAFERVSSLTVRDIKVSGAIGICKFNKIMLLSPRLLLRGYRWRDSLVHEYVHYLLVALSANGAPLWLQEGVARYGETLWRADPPLFFTRADEGLLAEAVESGSLIPFDDMHPSLVRLPSMTHVRLAFAQCSVAVEYLLSRWGVEGLRGLLAGISVGSDASAAMERSIGLGMAQFEKEWLAHLKGMPLRPMKGLQVRELKMVSEAGGEDQEIEHWQSLGGRRNVKLGDMLRSRGRNSAALREYRKALESAPASPLVLNRMAKTLMDLGRFTEAETHLLEAVGIHPDYAATYASLAAVRAASGDWNGAETALREYLAINPFDPFVWRDLGNLLLNGGRTKQGEAALETAGRLGRAIL